MSVAFRLAIMIAVIGTALNAEGYEQASHAFMTRTAYYQSDLNPGVDNGIAQLSRSLGIDTYSPFGAGTKYFEFVGILAGVAAFDRTSQNFENDILKSLNSRPRDDLTLAWLMFGAIREDDNPSEDPPTPQDVAPGLKRPLSHFFDPYLDRPLTFTGLYLIDSDVHKNPDWAIGSRDSFNDPNLAETPRRNYFSIFDARESMFRALTLMTHNGTDYVDIAPGKDAATRQQWRQAYWATTFRALGDVLHLNQDMAQPQHTRNEPHSGKVCPTSHICLGGHTSVYEKYINARALAQSAFETRAPFGAAVKIRIAPLPAGSYPIPTFSRYTDYWSTAPGSGSVSGKGLADYSNQGFFTAGGNLGATVYPKPSSNVASYTIRSLPPTNWDGSTSSDTTPLHVYYGAVDDAWQQASTADVPLTTYSLWDQFLISRSAAPAYSLNHINYDAMANLLLPRAAAYSAGLINFFFRGRIDIALPDEGVFALADHASTKGFTKLRAKIRNTTPTFTDAQGAPQPQHMTDGRFFAVVRYHKDKQYVTSLDTAVGAPPCTNPIAVVNVVEPDVSTQCRDGVERTIVSRPLDGVALQANEQKLVEFEFGDSPIPFDMTDVVLQVVYRGELGSESDAVAVGTADISEPTYFAFQNDSDYVHLGDSVYTRPQVDSDINLLSQVQPRYCVDYRQSPPHLIDTCLKPIVLDLVVSFGDLSNPLASVTGLPGRRFIRVAYLTVSDEGINTPIAKNLPRSTKETLRVTASLHQPSDKALLNQNGTCLPHDPYDIPPRHSQFTVLSRTQVHSRVDPLTKLRGVNGWLNSSCVLNGDNAEPGAPDNRVDVMSPLTPQTEEIVPYAVTIMPKYL